MGRWLSQGILESGSARLPAIPASPWATLLRDEVIGSSRTIYPGSQPASRRPEGKAIVSCWSTRGHAMSRYLYSRPSVDTGASDTASFSPIGSKLPSFLSFFFSFLSLPSSRRLSALLSRGTRCLALSAPREPSLQQQTCIQGDVGDVLVLVEKSPGASNLH